MDMSEIILIGSDVSESKSIMYNKGQMKSHVSWVQVVVSVRTCDILVQLLVVDLR